MTGGGGSKLVKNSVTYFMDGPYSICFITPTSISARKVIVDEMSVDEMSLDEVL